MFLFSTLSGVKDLPIIQSMPIEYSVSDHYPVYAVIDFKNNLPLCANVIVLSDCNFI